MICCSRDPVTGVCHVTSIDKSHCTKRPCCSQRSHAHRVRDGFVRKQVLDIWLGESTDLNVPAEEVIGMGMFLNPGNSGFEDICRGRYVDKTGMIALINDTIGTPDKLTCITRPRRFGKSFAAQMLCAYYDKTCDSSRLFEDKEISQSETYKNISTSMM